MAPLALFRGQGGTTNTSAASVAVDPLPPPEPPRTPPPNGLRRSISGGGDPAPSPSRLNPARLLRRKGSRSIREPRDRGDREEGWFGSFRGQEQMAHSASDSLDRTSTARQSSSSVRSDAPLLRPSPFIRGLAHVGSPTLSTSPKMSHSRHGSASSIPAAPSTSAHSTNFGSARSMPLFYSDGASTHGDTEIILGPSPEPPLAKGEPSTMNHHPFLLPTSSSPSGNYPTPLSPPRRLPRSPLPPPPPLRTGPVPSGESRSSTPSSCSTYSDLGDSGQSTAATVRPSDARTDTAETVWRADTAAWLARRPSGRRNAPIGFVFDGRPRAESLGSHASPSVSGTSASGESVDEPLTPTVSPRIGGMPNTPTFSQQERAPVTAMVSPSPRRPSPPSPSKLTPQVPATRTPDRSGYVVIVQCLPSTDDEVRWEIVLRRSLALDADGIGSTSGLGLGSGSGPPGTPVPGGPFLLAPGIDGAQNIHAPPFASSVNLSLSLDTEAPSGKLQFITLPSAAPIRVRPRSSSQSAGPASPRSYRAPQSPNCQSLIPRDSIFGASILGPPVPLANPPSRQMRSHTPPPADPPRAPQEPLSPRSAAYKRQGAVWAASGGFSSLSGEDVFTTNPHMPSPRAARERASQLPDGLA
ncbi:hypothetical protein CspeluHIS016_0404070 [Cutaneotrichosporon spelunceum]|uniref:Uncharacterized protein n=1 Tax=Cutaneotrichosporon spelunceum TaxID=1672016 RepID=A0AAD3TVS7_9TREE|nr:hypothetical protein CspeluHIS016_0404070 [Cutaneotrichosporon spelunceum]